MGKVFFEDPVHHISGKISKKYRTCYNHKRINGLNFTSVHGERKDVEKMAQYAVYAKEVEAVQVEAPTTHPASRSSQENL